MKKIIHSLLISLALLATSTATAAINTTQAIAHSGDFNGDTIPDTLYQGRLGYVLIPVDDIFAPITFTPNIVGEIQHVDAGGVATVVRSILKTDYPGKAWLQNYSNVIIADFDGDQIDDILLQSKSSSGKIYLFLSATSNNFTDVTQEWGNGYLGLDWTADKVTLEVGDFNNDGILEFKSTNNVTLATGIPQTKITYIEINSQGQILEDTRVSSVDDDTPQGIQNYAVAKVSGGFSVGASGAASYSVPITLPPGMAEMNPELSLSYSSQGGNGMLGEGWNLNGLSGITRCSQNYAEDGEVRSVKLDGDDRLCLGGMRLIAINGGVYGANNTEYRTAEDSFYKIIGHGSIGTDSAWFEAFTKSGQRYEYGNTPDSNIGPSGQPSLMWAVNKISDVMNNQVNVVYEQDSSIGYYVPKNITYMALDGSTVTVTFSYTERHDVLFSYMAGVRTSKPKLMSNINIKLGTDNVRDYQLKYNNHPDTAASQLTQITECAADGACKPPLTFEWQRVLTAGLWQEDSTFVLPQPLVESDGKASSTRLVDLNGDMRVDVIYNGGAYLNTPNTPTGWQEAAEYAPPTPLMTMIDNRDSAGVDLIDINGDGLLDLVKHTRDKNGTVSKTAYLNTGTGWNTTATPEYAPPFELIYQTTVDGLTPYCDSGARFVELNGDGLIDQVISRNGKVGAYLNTGTGWAEATDFNPPISFTENCKGLGTRLLDLDQDGREDLVVYVKGGTSAAHINTGDGWQSVPDWAPKQPLVDSTGMDLGARFVDINGDGLVDQIAKASGSYVNEGAWLNTGKGWVSAPEFIPMADITRSGVATGTQFIDINGDGWVDQLVGGKLGKTAYINTGVASTSGKAWYTNNYYAPTYLFEKSDGTSTGAQFADINADGIVDQVMYRSGSTNATSTGKQHSRRIYAINDGFGEVGNVTEITYKPLTDTTFYNISDISQCVNSYPLRCVQPPMYVVSDYAVSDGIDGKATYSYTYHDLWSNVRGIGLLGFDKVVKLDNQTNTETITEFASRAAYSYLTANRHDFHPYKGMHNKMTTKVNGITVKEVVNTLGYLLTTNGTQTPGYPYFAYFATSTESAWELDETHMSTTLTENTYDSANGIYGFPTTVRVTTTDEQNSSVPPFITETNSTYDHYPLKWHLGRVIYTEAKHTAFEQEKIKRASFTYYDSGIWDGLLKTSVEEPGNIEYELTTTYTYDSFGNKTETMVKGNDSATYLVPARSTKTYYSDAQGDPLDDGVASAYITTENALVQKETKELDPRFGTTLSLTGPNGLTTTWQHDSFGRQLREIRADKNWTDTSRSWCLSGCLGYNLKAVTAVTQQSSGSAPEMVYSDSLGRTVLSEGRDINGYGVYTRKTYNGKGQLTQETLPYSLNEGNVPHVSYDSYDALGRVKKVTAPNGTITETKYTGLETTVTITSLRGDGTPNPQQQKTTKLNYANGKLYKVKDAADSEMTYGYDAEGNLLTVTAPGSVTTMTYDQKGRKVTMDDPDAGDWTYKYDALGQLRIQADTKGQKARFEYDLLGRKVLAIEPEGMSKWIYDTALGRGKGKLHSVAGPIPYDSAVPSQYTDYLDTPPDPTTVSTTGTPFIRSYTYDASYGRLIKTTTVLNQADLGQVSYALETVYDDQTSDYDETGTDEGVYGRVKQIRYPVNLKDERLVIDYTYDSHLNNYGHLTKVTRSEYVEDIVGEWGKKAGSMTFPVWELGDADPATKDININGQIEYETYGNVVSHRKHDRLTGHIETIQSTNINTAQEIQDSAYVFDSIGNLDKRVDHKLQGLTTGSVLEETFDYDIMNRLETVRLNGVVSQNLSYNANGTIKTNDRPGVGEYSYITGTHRLLNTTEGGVTSSDFSYDANGNLETGAGRIISYTSYNKPYQIINNGKITSFAYDAEHKRYLMANSKGYAYYLSAASGVGMHFERRFDVNRVPQKDIHYLYAGDRMIGTYTMRADDHSETRYFHTDHLGSIEAVTDEGGIIVERRSYTAFGEARPLLEVNETYSITDTFSTAWVETQQTHRGFTGHEMLDDAGLIHMNGRVYDPKLGIFLSADPQVQFPESTQGYNRYGYTNNNPLSYVDYDGYGFFKSFFRAVKRTVNKAVSGVKKLVKQINPLVLISPTLGLMYSDPVMDFFRKNPWAGQIATIAAGIVGGPPASAGFSAYLADINGGDPIKAFATSFATAWAFQEVGAAGKGWNTTQRMFAHGMVGGVSSVAQGGKFESGFISAAAGKGVTENLMPPQIGTWHQEMQGLAAASIAGGVGAELGGGKFSNGAKTAAMGYIFNRGAGEMAEQMQRGRGLVKVNLKGIGETFLDTEMAEKVQTFIDSAAEGGVDLHFNGAFRTTAHQAALQNDPFAITPAKMSLHSAGLAVDVNYSSLASDGQRAVVLQAAKTAGLKWGGNFKTPDPPHFYYNPGGDRKKLIDDAQYNYQLLNK